MYQRVGLLDSRYASTSLVEKINDCSTHVLFVLFFLFLFPFLIRLMIVTDDNFRRTSEAKIRVKRRRYLDYGSADRPLKYASDW